MKCRLRCSLDPCINNTFTYLEIDVVLLEMLFGSLHELHSDEFESSLLESFDDVTDESALNSIGLHHDESAFLRQQKRYNETRLQRGLSHDVLYETEDERSRQIQRNKTNDGIC